MKNDRLMKKRMEAEHALLEAHGRKSKSATRGLKKKEDTEVIRKEINYWLDSDSPYAEYLVARFREWAPNPNIGVSI